MIGAILDATEGSGYSGLAASLVFVATSFPQFVLMPWAGTVADRFDRRSLIIWGSVVQTAAALSFCAIGGSRWWIGIGAQLVISVVSTFLNPATSAAIPNLVAPADVAGANALLSSTFGITLALGSMFGGIFAATFGRTASFVANAVSFLAVAALVALVRRPFQQTTTVRPPARPFADTRVALALARRDPFVLSLFGARLAFGVTIGAVGVLPLISTEVFHHGDSGTGLLLAARGIGFLFGPLVVSAVVRRGSTATITSLAAGLAVFGLGYLVVGLAPTLAIACVGVFIGHLGGGSISTISSVALQLATPDEVRGRMVATDRALAALSQTLSYPLVGLAAGWFGATTAVLGLRRAEHRPRCRVPRAAAPASPAGIGRSSSSSPSHPLEVLPIGHRALGPVAGGGS